MFPRSRIVPFCLCLALICPALCACQPRAGSESLPVPQPSPQPDAQYSAASLEKLLLPDGENTLYRADLCPTVMSLGEDVADIAQQHLGVRYKSGGTSPKSGFDCSGFVYWVFSKYGVSVPRDTVRQSRAGQEVARSDLLPGDIIIFRIGNTPNGRHSAIYIGDDKFIHSPSAGSHVRIENLNAAYWAGHYMTARRVLEAPPCNLDLYAGPEANGSPALLELSAATLP